MAEEKFYKTRAIPFDAIRRNDPKELKQYGRHPMTAQEIVQQKKDEADEKEYRRVRDAKAARRAALAEKWPDEYALIDDILARGADAVRADRAAIKAQFPKPVEK